MTAPTKTIRYEINHLHQEFLEIISEFSREMQTEKIQATLGKDWCKQLRTQENKIRKRIETDFSLVVVGEFKRGKSTLINALLGKEIVTTNITPETVTINEIHYGEELKISGYLSDGGIVELETEELKAERLVPLLKKIPQNVTHLRIEAPIEWLKGLCLVDTPGTGDIFQRFDSQVHAYLSQADAVIFVISALSPLSESERAFLKLSLLPQDFPKLFFVVNRMDNVHTAEEAEELLNHIGTKINSLFPKAQLLGISAKDEFCRIESLSRPNLDLADVLEKKFVAFQECLQESILLNRDLIQMNRATEQMEHMLQGVESKILLLQKAMQRDKIHLAQAISQYEDESSQLFAKIKQHRQQMCDEMKKLEEQAVFWIDEFINRLDKEAIATISSFQIADIQRHYHFFLSDSLSQAINQCVHGHYSAILEIMDKAAKEISQDFHNLTKISWSDLDLASATFGELPWTELDTIHLVIDRTPLKFVADLLIRQAKESRQSSKASIYKQKLTNALPELRYSAIQHIQHIYTLIIEEAEQQIETAYQQEIKTSLSALKQAQQLSNEGQEKANATNTRLKETLSLISRTRSYLQNFKHKFSEDLSIIN